MLYRIGVATIAVLSCAVSAARAQPAASFQPATGSTAPGNESGVHFGLLFNTATAYDDNLQADLTGSVTTPSAYQVSGFYTMLAPNGTVEVHGKRVQFTGTGGTNVRYYSDFDRWLGATQYASAALAAQPTARTTMFFSQYAAYAPVNFDVFPNTSSSSTVTVPTVTPPPTSDYAATEERSYTFTTAGAVKHDLTSRTSLSLNSNFRYADFVGTSSIYSDFRSFDVSGGYFHRLDRNVTLRLGYTVRDTEYARSPSLLEHSLDIGAEYARPLSASRKMVLAFSAGPTMASGPIIGLAATDMQQQYRLTAEGRITYPFTRTWNGQLVYRRGTAYIESLALPVFSNALSVAASGFVTRRSDLNLSGGYSQGDSSLTGTQSPYTTYTANARYRLNLNQTWATYAEYLYYFYDFNQGTLVSQRVSPQLTRNSVRVGLTLWFGSRGK